MTHSWNLYIKLGLFSNLEETLNKKAKCRVRNKHLFICNENMIAYLTKVENETLNVNDSTSL